MTNSAVTRRLARQRGHTDYGWLDSWHSFSFGEYHDPDHMGFRTLRVINEDRVAGGGGFPTHPHRDMEIFSYVLDGALEHRDSLGNGRVLEPGQVQLMSAGTGVTHSEFNPHAGRPTHFLQVWIRPRRAGLKPSYTEWTPTAEQEAAPKVLIISPDGRDGSATIAQDADVYRLRLPPQARCGHELRVGRGLWLQVMRGAVTLNGVTLETGDGAALEQTGPADLQALEAAEALLFDLG